MHQIESILKSVGARTGPIRAVKAEHDVARMVPYDGSVVMVGVNLQIQGKIYGHAFYAYRTPLGQLRYMDRTVQAANPNVYRSIDEIKIRYQADWMTPTKAMTIENMFAKTVGHEAPRLALPALGVIASQEGV